MNIIELNPNEIITLNDYPVHSNEILKKYYNECKLGKEIPLVPVIRKEIVRKYLDNKLFEEFVKRNSKVKYFMLDGSHRTTALTLAGRKIKVVVYETDKDIIEAKESGKVLKSETLEHTIEENCEILKRHFEKKTLL
jgi:hypothetical protein